MGADLLRDPSPDTLRVPARVVDVQYHGASSRIELELADGLRLVASVEARSEHPIAAAIVAQTKS